MAGPQPKAIPMRNAQELFGKIALTNHYEVSFSTLNESVLNYIRDQFNVPDAANFICRKTGILCSEASLPTTSYATAEVKGDFMGVPQEFAHTRLYTDIDFTFYVDRDYNNLKVFEGWMDYISSGGGADEKSSNFYRRFKYPDTYKCDTMHITKFEKDIEKNPDRKISYQFFNTFPKSMTSIPVSYGSADLLKVNVSFNYDRYLIVR